MPYVPPELVTDSTAQASGILEALEDLVPGWEPREGSFETSVSEAFGITAATIGQFIIDHAAEAYADVIGERVLGLTRVPANAASALSTWTAKDGVGYLIPAGSTVVATSPLTGQPVEFQTVIDANVIPGQTTVEGVEIQAAETGPEPNGATGVVTQFEGLPFVTGVVITTAAAGGEDDETDLAYIDRLADRARRQRAIPITASDYAAFTRDVPGIERAGALNLLNYSAHPNPTGALPYNLLHEIGHVTVFGIDVDGNPIDALTKAAAVAYLTGDERPLGVTVHMGDATITDLAVVATIRLNRGADETGTKAAARAAVAKYFDPATWRYSAVEPGLWSIPTANVDRVVRAHDIASVIDGSTIGFETAAPGVQSTVTCTVNGAAEVELGGWAPLPNLVSVAVSIAS